MGTYFITNLFMLEKCQEQNKQNNIIIQQTTGLIRQVL